MYKITALSGKGRCVIATHAIPKGQVVIKERPYLVAEDAYDAIFQMYDQSSDGDGDMIRPIFESLCPQVLDRYILSYQEICEEIQTLPVYMRDTFTQMRPQRLRLLLAKFYRNAFSYTSPPCALLATGTLLNHSCDNNIDFTVNKKGEYEFIANRDIDVGEELCDSYLQTNSSKKKRVSALETQYGFICGCVKCADARSISEGRRT